MANGLPQITSMEQLKAFAHEAEHVILSIRVAQVDGQKHVTVRTFDGRSGEKVIKGVTTGNLSEREWDLAFVLCAYHTSRKAYSEWTASRFPDFEQTAAGRPVAGTVSGAHAAGEAVLVRNAEAPEGERWHVYLTRNTRFIPRDETNERDDAVTLTECVEPTEFERSAEFVQWCQERADANNEHDRFMGDWVAKNPFSF